VIGRRAFVSGALLAPAALLAACSSGAHPGDSKRDTPAASADGGTVRNEKISYGPDAAQYGELYRPERATHAGVVVIIHGGFWQAQYTLSLGRPLAEDLAARGYVCWNLEYRRVGNGGGWPATFDDVAAGMDKLADIDGLDTSHVVAVGHSAGGQLAVWALGRPALPADSPGAAPRVRLRGVVSQAGVLDLAVAATTGVGGSAEDDLMGGSPAELPQRYRLGDPIEQVPLPQPVYCVHSRADANVPFAQSTAYVAAARKAGGHAVLREVQGDHFTLIDPTSAAWHDVRAALPQLLAGELPAA
jgi:acetyl esterase/lipase